MIIWPFEGLINGRRSRKRPENFDDTTVNSSLTELYRLVVYMTINNFRNFDDNSLGKLSSVIFVTMMTIDDLFNADSLATLDGNSMV
jgi:hypothetical protein